MISNKLFISALFVLTWSTMVIYARTLNKNIAIAMRYTKQVDEQQTRNFMQCIVDDYTLHGSNKVRGK